VVGGNWIHKGLHKI